MYKPGRAWASHSHQPEQSRGWRRHGQTLHSPSLQEQSPAWLLKHRSTSCQLTKTCTCTVKETIPSPLTCAQPCLKSWKTNLLTQKDDSWMSPKALPAHWAQVKPGEKCTEAKLQRIPAAKFLKKKIKKITNYNKLFCFAAKTKEPTKGISQPFYTAH